MFYFLVLPYIGDYFEILVTDCNRDCGQLEFLINFSEFMRFGFRFLSFIWPWQLLYFIFSKVTTLELTLVEPILESNNRVHLISDLWGRTYIRRLDIYPVHIELWRHHFLVDSKIKAGIDIVSDLNLKSSYFLSGSILLML